MTTTQEPTVTEWITKQNFLVFTVTWYNDASDIRLQTCLRTLEACASMHIAVVVVDSSPPPIRDQLKRTGAIVVPQQTSGRKGVALREAAAYASTVKGVGPHTMLCWQEAEKTDMIRLWSEALASVKDNCDILVPRRDPKFFQETYPIEQYHSENYGNLYLDAVAREHAEQMPSIDWHFGPLAFRSKHVELWTTFSGDSYDAQLVPIVHGARKGLTIASVPVDFKADLHMKAQEENNVTFIEKRLAQLNELDPRVKKAWTEDFYC